MARGSPLSRSCMQGQPSDAASGVQDTREDLSARRQRHCTWIKPQGQATTVRLVRPSRLTHEKLSALPPLLL